MKTLSLVTVFIFWLINPGCSQNTGDRNRQNGKTGPVGGPCEGCEAIYECPVPFNRLPDTDTLPDFFSPGSRIEISGTVYLADGITPAKDVVLYFYHTDQTGIYPRRGDEKGWARRHGYLRGWVKTGSTGFYRFYTLRPAPYPGRKDPAHIHIIVKEPGVREYWIDEFLFDDDPLLTPEKRRDCENRGGSGILTLSRKNGLSRYIRPVYLGRNVPGYPGRKKD